MGTKKSNAYTQAINADNCNQAVYQLLANAHTIDDLFESIQRFVHELSFTHFLYIQLGQYHEAFTWDNVLSNMPKAWEVIYKENRLQEHDQVIAYARENYQPIVSSQIYGYLSGAPFISLVTRYNRKIIQLNTSFGYSDSLVIPCVSESGRGNALLILTSPHVGTDDFSSMLISKSHQASCLCKAIDAVCVRKFRSSRLNFGIPKLSDRPLSLLRSLAKEDFSIAELADEVNISPITAHQHISAARKALNVKTNIAAVMRGIKLGIINV